MPLTHTTHEDTGLTCHFPDTTFDAAIFRTVAARGVMYGTGVSDWHIPVPAERDTDSIFGDADAESSFYALQELATREVVNMRLERTARNVFAMLATMFLTENAFTFEVGRWLGIANALIVGREEYLRKHGYLPINNDAFVYDYMEHGAEHTLRFTY